MTGTFGPSSPTPFGYYDPASRSLKTSRTTFDSDSTLSSQTLPTSGSMRNGSLYEQTEPSAPPTSAADSSSSPLLKTPTAQLAVNGGSQHPDKRKAGGARADTGGRGRALAADADSVEVRQQPVIESGGHGPSVLGVARPEAYGAYAPAVARWEAVTGRRAPWATDDRGRLSTPFVEWMMGLPAGHVTAVPELTRNEQLKALGNGVVPQQAAAALRLLADRAGLGVAS